MLILTRALGKQKKNKTRQKSKLKAQTTSKQKVKSNQSESNSKTDFSVKFRLKHPDVDPGSDKQVLSAIF